MSQLNQYSSLGSSIAAYQPYYAPPVAPQTNYINGGASNHQIMPPNAGAEYWDNQNLARRDLKPRRNGMRYLFSRGGQTKKWFRMIATGAVESTKFQPESAWTWGNAGFNDALYQAGYPRNLGISEKVPGIPPQALGIQQSQMLPAPRITKSIFTNRRYSGPPSLPATPTNGQHS